MSMLTIRAINSSYHYHRKDNSGMQNQIPFPTKGERKTRSLIKAVSWRVIALLVLGAVSYMFTGNWEETSLITLIYSVIQIFIYFAHERIWERIKWGKPTGVEQLPHAQNLTPEESEIIHNRLRDLGYIE